MMRESMVERLYKRYLQRGVGGRARDTQEEEDHQECGTVEVVVVGRGWGGGVGSGQWGEVAVNTRRG